MKGKSTYFVTGFPGFIGKRLVAELAEERRDSIVYLLVLPKFFEDAKRYVRTLPRPVRFEVLQGDIVDMHLGLSGSEYARLCEEVTDVFHLAAVYYPGAPRESARRVNVEGTRNLLELARDCRNLRRFSHFSTAFVAGDREGVVMEDELDKGQGFRNAYEDTKFQAEKLVRKAMRDLPAVILRPSIVVGDSRTGEIDRFDGPYYLGIMMVTSPLAVPLPLPGPGIAPLHVVPIDYVVKAALAISEHPEATGKTFHLVDPNPMSSRRIYELVAERVHRRLPRVSVPARAAEALLKIPLLGRLTRPQQATLGYLNQLVFFNAANAAALLEPRGILCPPLPQYLPKLIDFVRGYYRRKRQEATSRVEDPLDLPLGGSAPPPS